MLSIKLFVTALKYYRFFKTFNCRKLRKQSIAAFYKQNVKKYLCSIDLTDDQRHKEN